MHIALFHAHSGLRYLVLLAGLVLVAYCLFGLATRRPYTKAVRILGAVFSGLLDLQILLGLVLVLTWPWYPALIGHIVMMLLAAGVAHGALVVNRKRAQPGLVLPLVAGAGALALIAGGVMAIGRHLLQTTPMG
jgi:hypothetical protein